jgi:hypothetical protein
MYAKGMEGGEGMEEEGIQKRKERTTHISS